MLHKNDSSLFDAIQDEERGLVKKLLKNGADITIKNAKKKTPIQYAKELDDWRMVELIASTCDTDSDDNAKYGDALLSAVRNNQTAAALALIKAGAPSSWFSTDENYESFYCLHWAIQNKNLELLKVLIKNGHDLTTKNKKGQTPIQLAVKLGFWEGIDLIAKLKITDKNDAARYASALFSAIRAHKKSNKLAVISSLTKAGASLTVKNAEGETPFYLAANLELWDCIEAMLAAKPLQSQNEASESHKLALLKAVRCNAFKTVELLLKAHVPTTGWSVTDSKSSLLHEATLTDNPELVSLLLKHGADQTFTNNTGQTPLEFACANGKWKSAGILSQSYQLVNHAKAGMAFIDAIKAQQLDIAHALLNAGAPISEQSEPNHLSALHWAVSKNDLRSVHFLLENNASQTVLTALTALDCPNETPIEMAARLGHWNCVQALLEFDFSNVKQPPTIKELHYEQVLLYAVKAGNFPITKLLLELNTPCNQWDTEKGNIVLYEAIQLDRPDLVELLVSFGADPQQKNGPGETSFALAKRLNHSECMEALKKSNGSNDNWQYAREQADKLFKSLTDNRIPAKDLPATIKNFLNYQQTALRNTITKLDSYKDTLETESPPSTSTYTALLSNQHQQFKLNDIHILIKAMSTILLYPNNPIENWKRINELSQTPHSPEAKQIVDYITRKQKIDAYALRVKGWLEKQKNYINDHIDHATQPWMKKNIFNIFVKGIPNHIKEIKKLVDKLNDYSSTEEIIDVYYQVIQKFSSVGTSTRRHDDTISYYQRSSAGYEGISFEDVAAPVYYQTMQPSFIANVAQASQSAEPTFYPLQSIVPTLYVPQNTIYQLPNQIPSQVPDVAEFPPSQPIIEQPVLLTSKTLHSERQSQSLTQSPPSYQDFINSQKACATNSAHSTTSNREAYSFDPQSTTWYPTLLLSTQDTMKERTQTSMVNSVYVTSSNTEAYPVYPPLPQLHRPAAFDQVSMPTFNPPIMGNPELFTNVSTFEIIGNQMETTPTFITVAQNGVTPIVAPTMPMPASVPPTMLMPASLLMTVQTPMPTSVPTSMPDNMVSYEKSNVITPIKPTNVIPIAKGDKTFNPSLPPTGQKLFDNSARRAHEEKKKKESDAKNNENNMKVGKRRQLVAEQ